MRQRLFGGVCLSVVGALCCSALLLAAASDAPVADAAMQGNRAAVKNLLEHGADVNAAQHGRHDRAALGRAPGRRADGRNAALRRRGRLGRHAAGRLHAPGPGGQERPRGRRRGAAQGGCQCGGGRRLRGLAAHAGRRVGKRRRRVGPAGPRRRRECAGVGAGRDGADVRRGVRADGCRQSASRAWRRLEAHHKGVRLGQAVQERPAPGQLRSRPGARRWPGGQARDRRPGGGYGT